MSNLTEKEQKEYFIEFVKRINAVEFPNETDEQKTIHILSADENFLMAGTYFLQSNVEKGFSLIIVEVDNETIDLKIHNPFNDDFYVKENIVIKKNATQDKELIKSSQYFSTGLITVVNGQVEVSLNNILKVPLKSVSFQKK